MIPSIGKAVIVFETWAACHVFLFMDMIFYISEEKSGEIYFQAKHTKDSLPTSSWFTRDDGWALFLFYLFDMVLNPFRW